MRTSLFTLVVLAVVVGCARFAYGGDVPHAENCASQAEKIYLHPHDVNVFSNQILVHVDGQWWPISELYADDNGIYLMKKVGLWYCKVCHWHNEDVSKCFNCGSPRP